MRDVCLQAEETQRVEADKQRREKERQEADRERKEREVGTGMVSLMSIDRSWEGGLR